MGELELQYDGFANEFVEGTDIHNQKSRKAYYSALDDITFEGKRVLDIGCGDGWDVKKISERDAIMYGLDSSKDLVKIAKDNNPGSAIIEGNMDALPYKDEFFDVVLSKYAIQTSTEIPKVISEIDRVLKPGGTMAYLAVHPLRQFLEKKKHPKDYFLQEIVESRFFGGSVSAFEPTHTLAEYLNPEFLTKYHITHFKEYDDFPSSEKIDGDTYPCFFVLKAIKQK